MNNWENDFNNDNENNTNHTIEADYTVKDSSENSTDESKKQSAPYAFETITPNNHSTNNGRNENHNSNKNKGSGGIVAAIVAVCVAVAIISGIVTNSIVGKISSGRDGSIETSATTTATINSIIQSTDVDSIKETTTYVAPTHLETTESVGNKTPLRPEDIYENCSKSVVIFHTVTEIVSTNIWGQVSKSLSSASASGVVYSSNDRESYIVTNYHVANPETSQITIELGDGSTVNGQYVCGDELTDIALVRIERGNLTPATIGKSSELRVGNYIAIIGNPLNFGLTFADGKISALPRTVLSYGIMSPLLQVTSPINGGNSGGGLFNEYGELVGIVNSKISSASVEGVGFAIPMDIVTSGLSDLLNYGYITGRASLGITTSSRYLIYPNGTYTAIRYAEEILSNSPAEKAGIKSGDIVYSIGGTQVTSTNISSILSQYKVGDTVELIVLRSSVASNSSYLYAENYTEIKLSVTFEEFHIAN